MIRLETPDDLTQWVASAAPGDAAIYHIGFTASGAMGRKARELHEAGMVALVSRRVGPGSFAYIVQRSAPPKPRGRGR